MKYGAISIDPEIMGGTPVFAGTRVPIQTLFDYLEGGDTLEDFLDDFPSVTKDQVQDVLEVASKTLTTEKLLNEIFASNVVLVFLMLAIFVFTFKEKQAAPSSI